MVPIENAQVVSWHPQADDRRHYKAKPCPRCAANVIRHNNRSRQSLSESDSE